MVLRLIKIVKSEFNEHRLNVFYIPLFYKFLVEYKKICYHTDSHSETIKLVQLYNQHFYYVFTRELLTLQ